MNLDHRVRFERRVAVADHPYGRPVDGWAPKWGDEADEAERWARFESKTGGETFAGRIDGRQAYEVVIRRDPETETITNADRVFVYRGGLFLNIRSAAPFPPDPLAFLILTLEAGGANG